MDRYYHLSCHFRKVPSCVRVHRNTNHVLHSPTLTLLTSWLFRLTLFLSLRNCFGCLLVARISIRRHKALWTGRLHKTMRLKKGAQMCGKKSMDSFWLRKKNWRIKLFQGNVRPERMLEWSACSIFDEGGMKLFWDGMSINMEIGEPCWESLT